MPAMILAQRDFRHRSCRAHRARRRENDRDVSPSTWRSAVDLTTRHRVMYSLLIFGACSESRHSSHGWLLSTDYRGLSKKAGSSRTLDAQASARTRLYAAAAKTLVELAGDGPLARECSTSAAASAAIARAPVPPMPGDAT